MNRILLLLPLLLLTLTGGTKKKREDGNFKVRTLQKCGWIEDGKARSLGGQDKRFVG